MNIFVIIFIFSSVIIFWAMIGYNISLNILGRIFKNRKNKKNIEYKPYVTVLIVAHNEEKVIYNKLINIINNDYPK